MSLLSLLLALPLVGAVQEDPLSRLPADKAGEVVRRAIEYAGGFPAWAGIRTEQFRKTTIRFRPDGSEESRRVQRHRYVMRPYRVRIDWQEGGSTLALVNDGRQAWKLVDGRRATDQQDVNQARNASFGSHYVFNMPFKLLDAGVHLEYAGRERLRDGTLADKIRVSYDKGAGDAGGLHTWWYFFDASSGRLCANLLEYEKGKYDYTEYLDDKPLGPLKRLSTRRYGYEAGAKGPVGRKVSEIVYDEIEIDVALPESLFAEPR